MGREVRRVPPDWLHPKDEGVFTPLLGNDVVAAQQQWDEGQRQWEAGFVEDYVNGGWKPREPDVLASTYIEWSGERPDPANYMPVFAEGIATHYMMYETVSEGTPISPAFATPEELASWLVANNASACAGQGASYEGWLRVAKGGYAPSMVIDAQGARSGVDM